MGCGAWSPITYHQQPRDLQSKLLDILGTVLCAEACSNALESRDQTSAGASSHGSGNHRADLLITQAKQQGLRCGKRAGVW